MTTSTTTTFAKLPIGARFTFAEPTAYSASRTFRKISPRKYDEAGQTPTTIGTTKVLVQPLVIVAFNTGRCYTSAGQRIAATMTPDGGLLMVDIDRGIDYLLPASCVTLGFTLTERDVLHAYDYQTSDWRGAYDHYELVRVLHAAARALPTGCR
jgi:hypothetical protein